MQVFLCLWTLNFRQTRSLLLMTRFHYRVKFIYTLTDCATGNSPSLENKTILQEIYTTATLYISLRWKGVVTLGKNEICRARLRRMNIKQVKRSCLFSSIVQSLVEIE